MEKIEEFLTGLCGCLATGKMYPVTHPQFARIISTAYSSLQNVLNDTPELVIGIVEDEIIFENKVLFNLTEMLQALIGYCKKKNIGKIYFYDGIKKEELVKFVSFILSHEKMIGDIQTNLSALGITNITASSITVTALEEEVEEADRSSPYENVLRKLSQYFEELFADSLKLEDIYNNLKLIVFSIIEKLIGTYSENCTSAPASKYNENIVHSLNVTILSMHFASKLEFNPNELIDVGMAALLYNIGNIASSQENIEQAYGMQRTDSAVEASIKGSKILLKYEKSFGTLPVIVSFESGLRYDSSSGEVSILYKQKQHTVSMIISICDFYDAAMKHKSSEGGSSRDEIYNLMTKEKQGWFHPQLLEKFFKIIGD